MRGRIYALPPSIEIDSRYFSFRRCIPSISSLLGGAFLPFRSIERALDSLSSLLSSSLPPSNSSLLS
ncbi:hypothetical protein PENTCL1PPCAC_20137 [Pristionchus entomophagus]|uniref:Uncharacterized protein n=1 Tax=Pristionchus entomophagus TaxID=358040 RepID=A0AAV5TU32_9BILA|nr:hypothetical protein PENTCL1PPCAC_20137 [Pristionchus entomophagus]